MASFDELLEQLVAQSGGGDGGDGVEGGASTIYDDLRSAHHGALEESTGNVETANLRIKELEEELSAMKAANFDQEVMDQPDGGDADGDTVDGQDLDGDDDGGHADDDAEYNSFDDIIGTEKKD